MCGVARASWFCADLTRGDPCWESPVVRIGPSDTCVTHDGQQIAHSAYYTHQGWLPRTQNFTRESTIAYWTIVVGGV